MSQSPHVAITASAGSGKTFQLAHRFLRLIMDGVAPERIVALTFSRKAAGEILESILNYTLAAAASDRTATNTAAIMAIPDPGRAAFLTALRSLVDAPHRLHIGTLDAFIIGIIHAFPAELGVAPDLAVMDEGGAEAQDLRLQAFNQIFHPHYLPPQDQAEFLEAFKQASFGREDKNPDRLLDRVITDFRQYFLLLPQPSAWGQVNTIWPTPPRWAVTAEALQAATQRLEAWVGLNPQLNDKARERWLAFLHIASRQTPRHPWDKDLDYVLDRLLPLYNDLTAGRATVGMFRKDVDLEPQHCADALTLLHHLLATQVATALTATRGMHRILEAFEAVYTDLTLRRGRMTFNDAQHLLAASSDEAPALRMSRRREVPNRLYIDYRLDAQLDHWLLDEFQDTSNLQWAAIENVIDEILQDAEGRRSFFYVGDVKQAIYTWRQGNARLFNRILDTYGPAIERRSLSVSYRSCPEIIATVNRIFENLDRPDIPADALARWRRDWAPHASAPAFRPGEGCVALLEPRTPPDEKKPDAEDRYRAAARIIGEINPLQRRTAGGSGLSVAILLRTNNHAADMVETLRSLYPGLPVAHEGKAPICDSPLVTVLLSLLRFALHPGDTFAWRHVQMSPLGPVLAAQGRNRHALPFALLRTLADKGIEAFLADWGQRLEAAHPLDPFGRRRLADLLSAAADYENSADAADHEGFLRFIETHAVGESASEGAVRVMTIHQAKGLGFDIVILPDLMDSGSLKGEGAVSVLRRPPAHSGDREAWILKAPRRALAACDPTLAQSLNLADEEAALEDLCVLYVALTRAKRALYLVTSFPGEGSTALTPASLIKERLLGNTKAEASHFEPYDGEPLGQLYGEGAPRWFESLPLATPAPETAIAEPPLPRLLTRPEDPPSTHLIPLEPSSAEKRRKPAALLFRAEAADVLDFGIAIHALMQRVTWLETLDVEAVLADWRATARVSPDVERDVSLQFRALWSFPDVAPLLTRPDGPVELWREKSFELITTDGQWLRGVFDRVVIERAADGSPRRATIIDFKSDRVETEDALARAVETYTPQLHWYGQALSRILGLHHEAIVQRLLFTRTGRALAVAWT